MFKCPRTRHCISNSWCLPFLRGIDKSVIIINVSSQILRVQPRIPTKKVGDCSVSLSLIYCLFKFVPMHTDNVVRVILYLPVKLSFIVRAWPPPESDSERWRQKEAWNSLHWGQMQLWLDQSHRTVQFISPFMRGWSDKCFSKWRPVTAGCDWCDSHIIQ